LRIVRWCLVALLRGSVVKPKRPLSADHCADPRIPELGARERERVRERQEPLRQIAELTTVTVACVAPVLLPDKVRVQEEGKAARES